MEARRYRTYDIWRSRVRLLEENVSANALDPEGVEQPNRRELLSEDLREPRIETPTVEAVARRLRRVYLPCSPSWVVPGSSDSPCSHPHRPELSGPLLSVGYREKSFL